MLKKYFLLLSMLSTIVLFNIITETMIQFLHSFCI